MFSITVLGSGTSVPTPGRLAPAYLLRAGDLTLLLDCGSGCTTALVEAGGDLGSLSGVALSHLHPDHTADLLPLLFAQVNPVGPRRRAPLPLRGPAGTAALLAALEGVYGRWVQPPAGLDLAELAPEQHWALGELTLIPFATAHTEASLAFRLEYRGRVICYSGDSGPCDGLCRAARGADLLVCECALTEEEEAPGHMRASDVGALARDAGCGQVLLSHLYPRVLAGDPLGVVGRSYAGPVALAADGMRLTLIG